jgi:hypothetical protein
VLRRAALCAMLDSTLLMAPTAPVRTILPLSVACAAIYVLYQQCSAQISAELAWGVCAHIVLQHAVQDLRQTGCEARPAVSAALLVVCPEMALAAGSAQWDSSPTPSTRRETASRARSWQPTPTAPTVGAASAAHRVRRSTPHALAAPPAPSLQVRASRLVLVD